MGTTLGMSCSAYQCFIPKKSYICALSSSIPLSDTWMDDLRAKSSDLGVYCTNILELINYECHSSASQVMF